MRWAFILPIFQSNCHVIMTLFRLVNIGSEHVIPDGEIEAVIGIGFLMDDGVVNPMHVRRHDDPAQYTVHPERQSEIGMIEHGPTVEHNLKYQNSQGRRAKQHDQKRFPRHR